MTLVEILVLVTMLSVVTAIVLPRTIGWQDRLRVARAVNDVRGFYHHGRLMSIMRGGRVRLDLRADTLVGVFEFAGGDSVFAKQTGPVGFGVALTTSNPTIRFFAGGVAAGPGNTTMTFQRGQVVDSLVTSRLGRLRRAQ